MKSNLVFKKQKIDQRGHYTLEVGTPKGTPYTKFFSIRSTLGAPDWSTAENSIRRKLYLGIVEGRSLSWRDESNVKSLLSGDLKNSLSHLPFIYRDSESLFEDSMWEMELAVTDPVYALNFPYYVVNEETSFHVYVSGPKETRTECALYLLSQIKDYVPLNKEEKIRYSKAREMLHFVTKEESILEGMK